MEIKSYKKKKNNLYEIVFSNGNKIQLYDDVILANGLLIKKELSDKELDSVLLENVKLESYYIALRFISIKLRTEKEIIKRLKNYNKESIDYTINRLKKEGYINNDLYIKAYINDSINLKLEGPSKIVYDLKKLGFNELEVTNYLNDIKRDVWLNKIDKYINKKINGNHKLSGMMVKNTIMKDLLTKGFLKQDINYKIDEYIFEDNKDIYEKEYSKIKNKLSRKYNGEELDYQIKIAMIKKGFKKDSEF